MIRKSITQILEWQLQGKITPVVDRSFAFAEAGARSSSYRGPRQYRKGRPRPEKERPLSGSGGRGTGIQFLQVAAKLSEWLQNRAPAQVRQDRER